MRANLGFGPIWAEEFSKFYYLSRDRHIFKTLSRSLLYERSSTIADALDWLTNANRSLLLLGIVIYVEM